jgi:hypothetical protein
MASQDAPPRNEPALEEERILMVYFTSTHARAKEVAPSDSHEGGQAKVMRPNP